MTNLPEEQLTDGPLDALVERYRAELKRLRRRVPLVHGRELPAQRHGARPSAMLSQLRPSLWSCEVLGPAIREPALAAVRSKGPGYSLDIASSSCGLVPSIGNECANAVSEREPEQQAKCEYNSC